MMQEREESTAGTNLSRQKRVGRSVQLGESDLERSRGKLSFVISGRENMGEFARGWLT